ncbi:hypothetical protein LAZ67_11001570 [Cordylochernes scorpioides]|uniref:Mos1 transposase HTH domain-containing protein n=1 Tax=Cordylochernes scorpioides TaxID=51811 RepID=A0ABY6L1A5_9ARAC|nr:hypothetical protein LAZ67_11001570 [Cordylochernes scorpioides]
MENQRICIKFCVKNGFKGAENLWMLQTAYGDAVMSRKRVFEWYKRFKEGREETADNERSRRPSTSTTPEKVDKVLELVRRRRSRDIIRFDSIDNEGHFVLVPKDLTFDQKNARKETASLNLEATTDDPELLKRVITEDETWIYGFDSETTQQASESRFKNEPRPKKARKAPSKIKVMLTVFFDYQGISWILHHDNAPAHTALKISKFLQDHSTSVFPQPPYSPDLAPCDFFLFGKLKKKGHECDPENRLPEVFCRLEKKRWLKCIAANGDYFERDNLNLMEQRAVIKFNAKLGRSASETYILMKKVYGTLCLSKSNVFIWHKRFSDGRNTLEDDKHTGRPSSSKTPESIEKVREFVANNRSASPRMMEEVLHIKKETIRTILHEDLGKTKVCAKFVPHVLTGEQKSLRIAHCRDIISAYENDSNFLKSIVTGDETWCFQYEPKTKRQSAEWKSKNSPQAKRTRKVPSKIKTMLITFFDSRGIIHKEFVPAGQTITGEYYLNVLKRLIARIRRIRPEYRNEDSWCLLHDNAPSHSSLIVRRFLAKNNVCVLNHPPYSPDLAPCDFY